MSGQAQKKVWLNKWVLLALQVVVVVVFCVAMFVYEDSFIGRQWPNSFFQVTPQVVFAVISSIVCVAFSCYHIFVLVKRTSPTQNSDSMAMAIILWVGQILLVLFVIIVAVLLNGSIENNSMAAMGREDFATIQMLMLPISISLFIIYTFFHVLAILKAKRKIKVAKAVSKTFEGVLVCGYCRGRNKLDAPVCVRCAGPLA